MPVGEKNEFNYDLNDCEDNTPWIQNVYSSKDEGESWEPDTLMQILFDKYHLTRLLFLDSNHAIGYVKNEISHPTRGYKIAQGRYYLVKNFQVVDSLTTPNDVHYGGNYNGHSYNVKNDTVYLGNWSYEEDRNLRKHFYQPFITKTKWKIEVEEKINSIPARVRFNRPTLVTKGFKNFKLKNNKELVFNNGAGTLTLDYNAVSAPYEYGYYIVENSHQIFVFDCRDSHKIIYFSFDQGTSWYVYPKRLEKNDNCYDLLGLDENNILSHFNFKDGMMNKVFHEFSPIPN